MDKTKNLIWIDLEMTGLNVQHDRILEAAMIITDSQLNILAEGPHFILHQSDEILKSMDAWCTKTHTSSGLVDLVRSSTSHEKEVETELLAAIKEYCDPNTALLAGNSIWQDRNFLAYYLPSIVDYCNYRLIDVSVIKELIRRWYPNHPQTRYQKPETHRALDDIKQSIEELQHFRKYFFVASE